jgi:hypothetical protein
MGQSATPKSHRESNVPVESTMPKEQPNGQVVNQGFSIIDDGGTLHLQGALLLWECGCGHFLVDHAPYPEVTRCTKCHSCTGFHTVD